MAEKPLGVCIVGCGFMGNIHAERWAGLPNARIVAAADILPDRGAAMAAKYELDRWYSDYRAAISQPEVDVASVCIPTHLHCEATLFAAQAKKHVLCEKPIARSTADARSMRGAAEANGVRLGIGLMRRHSPVAVALKDFLQSGALGAPLMAHAADIRQIRPKLAMHDPFQNGGPVIDMAVHYLDIWSYLFNAEVTAVNANGMTFGAGRDELKSLPELAVDTATINLRYANGNAANIILCWGLPPNVNPEPRPDYLLGPQGLVEVVWDTKHQHARWLKEGGAWEMIASSDEDMYQREIGAMARWILEGGDFPAQAEQGEQALQTAIEALALAEK